MRPFHHRQSESGVPILELPNPVASPLPPAGEEGQELPGGNPSDPCPLLPGLPAPVAFVRVIIPPSLSPAPSLLILCQPSRLLFLPEQVSTLTHPSLLPVLCSTPRSRGSELSLSPHSWHGTSSIPSALLPASFGLRFPVSPPMPRSRSDPGVPTAEISVIQEASLNDTLDEDLDAERSLHQVTPTFGLFPAYGLLLSSLGPSPCRAPCFAAHARLTGNHLSLGAMDLPFLCLRTLFVRQRT